MSKLKQGILFPSPPAYSFTSSRKDISGSGGVPPGPGAYASKPGAIRNNGNKFPRSTKSEKAPGTSPGPTDYDAFKGGIYKKGGYTIARRYNKSGDGDGVPGPSAYAPEKNMNKFMRKEPSATFGMAGLRGDEGKNDKIVPAPTDYNPKGSAFMPNGANFGRSGLKESKSGGFPSLVPGPGAYEDKRRWMGGGGNKFGRSTKKDRGDKNPGPADYPNEKYKRAFNTAGARIPRAKNLKDGEAGGPGPQSYKTDLSTMSHGKFSFGRAGLAHGEIKKEEFGPDYYNIPATVPDWPKYLLNEKKMKIHL
jgi:hypothetical protein